MTGRNLLALVVLDLRAAPLRAAVSCVGIALGVWVLTLVVALGMGTRQLVLREVVRELPVDMVEVVPKTIDLGLFKVGASSLFGGSALDGASLKRLRALPQVEAVFPRLEVKLPLGAQGGSRLFGHSLYTDLFMSAVPPDLVAAEGVHNFEENGDAIAVVLSQQLIELYNASVAPALGTPQLSASTLVGFRFEIVIGHSMLLGGRGAKEQGSEPAQIVGVSRYAQPLGVTVPLATAQRLLRRYGNESGESPYAAALLRVRHPADVPKVAEAALAMGFAIDRTADKTRKLLDAGTALAGSVGVLILLLAGLNIAHGFFATLSERRREFGVLRAVGARRVDLLALVLGQAGLLGLGGGLGGWALALGCGALVDGLVHRYVPNFPFRPESFFVFDTPLFVGVLGAALLASLVGAAVPAALAARQAIVAALAD